MKIDAVLSDKSWIFYIFSLKTKLVASLCVTERQRHVLSSAAFHDDFQS